MHEQRHAFQVLPIGAVNSFPVLHLRGSRLHYGLGLLGLRTAGIGPLAHAEAFLSFIGLGIQVPEASLGSLISDGAGELRFHPYLLWLPALVFSLLMICFNLLGDGLRDALDPKMRK